jgi:hypothetical protein
MYTDNQDRINAMISYFFLGPIFLLAKKNTPLANPYVHTHAKQSSMIIGITLIVFLFYIFVREYIDFSFLGVSLRTVVLTIIMAISSIWLMRWAYRAYHGSEGEDLSLSVPEHVSSMKDISWVYSVEKDEDRVRILASLLPWVGIYLFARYNNPLMEKSRIIASCFTTLIILTLLFTGSWGFLAFIFTVLYILLFVVEWVYLFIYGRFVSWNILESIPSYTRIEAHIVASLRSTFDFFRVVFGWEKQKTYKNYLDQAINTPTYTWEIPKYFMPASLIWLPFWNIFTLPSLFMGIYKPYNNLIIQWLLITLSLASIFLFSWIFDPLLSLLLLFPTVHIMTYASSDLDSRAPIIWLYIRIREVLWALHSDIEAMRKHEEDIGFVYDASAIPPPTSPDQKQI